MAKKKKIMVVDDDKKFLEELTETLRLSDYEPVTVGDSNLVLERVLEEVPDVILLDLKMYPKNGFEIAYALKHFVQAMMRTAFRSRWIVRRKRGTHCSNGRRGEKTEA